ncbi:UNVERIFIED_ORG: hypothetical protein GGE44_004591 [Rhizobium esperanzae]
MASRSEVHVFTAVFESNEAAFAFVHPHWEPEPDEHTSDEDYVAWEDRNPIWPMKEELGGLRIDADFVEVIWKSGMVPDWNYLKSRLRAVDVLGISDGSAPANTFVLIDQTAFGDAKPELRSTANLTYRGCYPSVL